MKKRIILLVILSLLCFIFTCKSLDLSNDTFYLIKLGDYIFHHGIDLLDHFSWIEGLVYTYPHWLYSLMLYFCYHFLGFFGVYLSSILSFITLIFSIYYINLKRNHDDFLAFFISLASIFVIKMFVVPRAQILSSILILWEIYFIEALLTTSRKKYVLYLVLDSLLLANIHGTIWLVFFIFYLPFIAENVICHLANKQNVVGTDLIKSPGFKLLMISFVLCFLMGILTPSQICYSYIFKTMQGVSQDYIYEHAPLVIIHYPIILITLFLLYFYKSKIYLHEVLMILGLYLMSFIGVKYLIFLYTIGFFYLSVLLKRYIVNKKDMTFAILTRKILFNYKVMVPILLVVMIVSGFKIFLSREEYISTFYPKKAVEYLSSLPRDELRLYNSYDIGSFLLFNDIKVFIDSRCDLYFKEFNHQDLDIFNDYVSVSMEYNYEDVFNKYAINYILLSRDSKLNLILAKDSHYETVYQDDEYIIYLRPV